MTDSRHTSDPGASSSAPGLSTPKAIGSLAKKPSDVTRQGSQKLKFVPTLPARRKKEDVKQEAPPPTIPGGPPDRGRGRGRRGRGGDGRGAAPRPPPVEMTASGPFAMGPALAGTSARRGAPRSNFAPIIPLGPGNAAALGAGLSGTAGPSLKRETLNANDLAQKDGKRPDDDDVYSDPDEGVEIIDMENVRQMDWMAPDSLRKERKEQKKKVVRVKKEDPASPLGLKKKEEIMDIEEAAASGEVDLANALDLSESEEEEELEDLIDDFSLQAETEQDADVRQERLYFFQFPEPFPTYVSNIPPESPATMSIDAPAPDSRQRKVSFAPDVKPPGPDPGGDQPQASAGPQAEQTKELPRVDGIIGELEIYRSGAVKMRLGNGIIMDVTGATQPSFLQQAVHVNMEKKRLHVLGEVNKRFVVSPDLDALLHAMELHDQTDANAMPIDDTNLIRMDP